MKLVGRGLQDHPLGLNAVDETKKESKKEGQNINLYVPIPSEINVFCRTWFKL